MRRNNNHCLWHVRHEDGDDNYQFWRNYNESGFLSFLLVLISLAAIGLSIWGIAWAVQNAKIAREANQDIIKWYDSQQEEPVDNDGYVLVYEEA